MFYFGFSTLFIYCPLQLTQSCMFRRCPIPFIQWGYNTYMRMYNIHIQTYMIIHIYTPLYVKTRVCIIGAPCDSPFNVWSENTLLICFNITKCINNLLNFLYIIYIPYVSNIIKLLFSVLVSFFLFLIKWHVI